MGIQPSPKCIVSLRSGDHRHHCAPLKCRFFVGNLVTHTRSSLAASNIPMKSWQKNWKKRTKVRNTDCRMAITNSTSSELDDGVLEKSILLHLHRDWTTKRAPNIFYTLKLKPPSPIVDYENCWQSSLASGFAHGRICQGHQHPTWAKESGFAGKPTEAYHLSLITILSLTIN